MSSWSPRARDRNDSCSLTSTSNVEHLCSNAGRMIPGFYLSPPVVSGIGPWETAVSSSLLHSLTMFGSFSSSRVGTIETYSNWKEQSFMKITFGYLFSDLFVFSSSSLLDGVVDGLSASETPCHLFVGELNILNMVLGPIPNFSLSHNLSLI